MLGYCHFMNIILFFCVACGGALGALLRYFLVTFIDQFGGQRIFPWGIFVSNVTGAFFLGVLIEIIALRGAASYEVRAFLYVGLLGGFTTFSAFTLDIVLMLQRGDFLRASAYIISSVGFSCLALVAGMFFIRSIVGVKP
tara:strand:- start:306 stop:725 length:420 start_codon:yes stop_codon:yes gene_type:complete